MSRLTRKELELLVKKDACGTALQMRTVEMNGWRNMYITENKLRAEML